MFYEFIGNVFHPYLINKNVEFPVILFVDGHKTHINYHLSQLCSQLKIELIALYPNATRILQPADVAAFRPLKVAWHKYSRKWQNENNQSITKQNFAPILNETVIQSLKPDILINGFRACGLCPFNPNAIDYTKCLGTSTLNVPETDTIAEDSVISFTKFEEIVGLTLLEELAKRQQNVSTTSTSVSFDLLFKLYSAFPHITLPRETNSPSIIATSNIPGTFTLTEDNVLPRSDRSPSPLPNAIEGNPQIINKKTLPIHNSLPTFSPKMKTPTKVPETSPKVTISYPLLTKSSINLKSPSPLPNSIEGKPQIIIKKTSLLTFSPKVKTPTKVPETSAQVTSSSPPIMRSSLDQSKNIEHNESLFDYANSKPSTSKCQYIGTEAATIRSHSQPIKGKCVFGEYFRYPDTPVRKGKRQIQRQPYAIT